MKVMKIKNSKLQALYKEGFSTMDIMDIMSGIKTVAVNNKPLLDSTRLHLALDKVVKISNN